MPRNVRAVASRGFLEKDQLIKLKLKAMRAGVWFRGLPRIDRVLVDLTIKVAHRVRSVSLAESILSVTRKLEGLLESRVSRAIREVGFPLASKLGMLARKLGHKDAWAWGFDVGFAQYLAVMKLNG
jgi:hypothetical protein